MLILAKVDLFLKSASCLILVLVNTRVGIQISYDSCGVNPLRFWSLKGNLLVGHSGPECVLNIFSCSLKKNRRQRKLRQTKCLLFNV